MKQNRQQTGFRIPAVFAMAAVFLAAPSGLRAASATALVSATVLGSAETEIAAGAVTVSNVSRPDSGRIIVAKAGRSQTHFDAVSVSEFRIAGGYNASYAVALPESVTVQSGGAEFHVSGFGPTGGSGRLAADGSATFGVSASVVVPAGQAPGVYTGSYPVTVAFD
jgi:hypothetical protein